MNVDLPILTVSISPDLINSYSVDRGMPVSFTAVETRTLIGSVGNVSRAARASCLACLRSSMVGDLVMAAIAGN